jgi:hypothetical protein
MYNKVHAAMQTGNLDELIELGVVKYDPESGGWVIDQSYKEGRLDEAVVGKLTGKPVRRRRLPAVDPADLLRKPVRVPVRTVACPVTSSKSTGVE